MFEDDDSPFLTVDETAALLRVKRRTLDNLRSSRKGPPARRHGGRIVYHRREVLDWSERRRAGTPPPRPAGSAPPRPGGNARDRLLAILSPRAGHPRLLWNASPSVPIGLYLATLRTPASGDLAVVRLPGAIRALAAARGYLGAAALLIKPVAAGPGDDVCRHEETVTINGRPVVRARNADASGRPLPRWNSCVTLAEGQVFLLSAAPDSFDSRYFGPVDSSHVLGSARLTWRAAPPDVAAEPSKPA